MLGPANANRRPRPDSDASRRTALVLASRSPHPSPAAFAPDGRYACSPCLRAASVSNSHARGFVVACTRSLFHAFQSGSLVYQTGFRSKRNLILTSAADVGSGGSRTIRPESARVEIVLGRDAAAAVTGRCGVSPLWRVCRRRLWAPAREESSSRTRLHRIILASLSCHEFSPHSRLLPLPFRDWQLRSYDLPLAVII